MDTIHLIRDCYTDEFTSGVLHLGDDTLVTIEPPWVPDSEAISTPYRSCVPDGTYKLVPHNGSEWKNTWALVNPALRVWHLPSDMQGPGRSACVFHVANFPFEVVGCIGPGLRRGVLWSRRRDKYYYGMFSSGAAMSKLRNYLNSRPDISAVRLVIECTSGTVPL